MVSEGRKLVWSALCVVLMVDLGCSARAEEVPPPVVQAQEKLAERLGVPVDQVRLVRYVEVEWSDASLGLPQPGVAYAQVITPGYRVILEAEGRWHEMHTDLKTHVVYAGTVPAEEVPPPLPAAGTQGEPPADPVAAVKADLAGRLNLEAATLQVEAGQEGWWPSTALGLPRPGQSYEETAVPGRVLLVTSSRGQYHYHVGGGAIAYAGPAEAWEQSVAYVALNPGDPNANGTLLQVSLLGTGAVRLLDGVSSFTAHTDGSLLAVRRTSRSGFDLLYLGPGGKPEPQTVDSAFDVACPVQDPAGLRWACLARPTIETDWQLWVGDLPQAHTKEYPPPPGTVRKLFWSQDLPGAEVETEQGVRLYQLLPEGDSGRWQELALAPPLVPGTKISDTEWARAVGDVSQEGTRAVRVVVEEYRGPQDRHERTVATLPGLDLVSFAVTGNGRFGLVVGRSDAGTEGWTVDLRTGETWQAVRWSQSDISLLAQPPVLPMISSGALPPEPGVG